MKVLVFAHVPPPHHGQSRMVQYLVDGLRARVEFGIEVHHVDARLSDDLHDVGTPRGGKVLRVLRYCAQALRLRWRHGIRVLYYVPSPPKRAPLIRDWLVLLLLRPWFPRIVLHWEAAGLGDWLETRASMVERMLTRALFGRPALSVVLAESNRNDAKALRSRATRVVPNGIEDPCPDFARDLAPFRRIRSEVIRRREGEVQVLFLALCTRDKGLFDALEAIALANAAGSGSAATGEGLRFRLRVAGTFPEASVEEAFRERCARPDLRGSVVPIGFLSGDAKEAAWRDADLYLFPTYYANEGQPVSLLEAMAHGVTAVTTCWRGIPEMLPANYPGLVKPGDPVELSRRLLALADSCEGLRLRQEFESRFTLDRYLEGMAGALRSLETSVPAAGTPAASGPASGGPGTTR
ncbi:MAG: glycosyltransferase [Verrucomicrobiae bacterium]|nr:glycosyltransferase [Verrucomicrobiae bacterium]